MWRIYYADGSVVQGETSAEWAAAPATGVQVVVRFPRQDPVKWSWDAQGSNWTVLDRDLWTGDDTYDPFGWGLKDGLLINWDDYMVIWRAACGDGDA